jgi:alpha-mannosidase
MPDPQADMGVHKFTYSLLPHSGSVGSETIKAAYFLNDPIITLKNSTCTKKTQDIKSLFKVDKDSVVIETIKKAQDGNGFIIRMYESLGGRGDVALSSSFNVKSCFETNLIEENIKQLAADNNQIKFNIKPFQILTLRIVPK